MSLFPLFMRPLAGAAMLAGLGLGAGEATAQEPTQLEDIVVEAAGLDPIEAGKVGSAFTVISGEDLERRQVRHAADALRMVAGVSVNAAGGPGTLTQARIRGAEGNHTLVLIDGVEVNSLDQGDFDFAALLIADIERIEVIRGPQSGVYGANALAGVINIVTRKGRGGFRATASVEAGSFNTHMLTSSASAGSDLGYIGVSAAKAESDGYNLARSGGEADGWEKTTFFLRGGFTPSEVFRLDYMLRYQKNAADIDSDTFPFDGVLDDISGDSGTREQRLGRISAELDTFGKSWTHKVFLSGLEDDSSGVSAVSAYAFGNEGERLHYGYQETLSFGTPDILAEHKLIGLVERRRERFSTWASYSPDVTEAQREQTGLVAEYQGRFAEDLSLTANIRRDLNETFEDATSYRIAAAYGLPSHDIRLHASFGKGIVNPTFFEQFGYALNFHGNPDLEPEVSIGWDAGIEKRWFDGRVIADLTYFSADLSNEIVGAGTSVVNQSGESQRQGIEVQLTEKPVDGLTVTASYTYTDSEDPDGSRETRRPKHAAALNAAYSFAGDRGQIDLGLIYNGRMQDEIFTGLSPYPRVALGDYVLVNLAASYRLDERVTLFARVQNLLDTDYQDVFSYAGEPLAAYAGVKIGFEEDAALEGR
jgi:vitamin B12 transporter